jgi:site-specific recombinase XerD
MRAIEYADRCRERQTWTNNVSRVGITKRIGRHTFRRTYSTLLRATGAEFKVMQALIRHSTIRVNLDTYTQAVTGERRAAQTAVVSLFIRKKRSKAAE